MADEINNGFKVPPITDGVVIDHIREGLGNRIVEALGIESPYVLNAGCLGKNYGRKDLLMVGRHMELTNDDIDILSLYAEPGKYITVNVIEDEKTVNKYDVYLPDGIVNVLACPNKGCATNLPTEIAPTLIRVERDGDKARFRCDDCEASFGRESFVYREKDY